MSNIKARQKISCFFYKLAISHSFNTHIQFPINRCTIIKVLFAMHDTKPTILADVEFQEFSEIGNIGRESNEIILTQCQLAEVGETEEFLKRGKHCVKEFAITSYCTCI